MRGREQISQTFDITQHLAKEFARYVNRVQNDQVDILGSFLIESEWENYISDSKEVLQSLELAGFVIMPREPTNKMIEAADASLGSGLMGQRGAQNYITHVFNAMVDEYLGGYDTNLVLDIFSMAIARASDPKARNDTSGENTSYQRFRKQAQDVVAGIQKNGSIIAPDEATPEMIAKGVSETAEKDAFEVSGRGELQLAVLIEQMRREGYEMSISRPRVLYETNKETGEKLEPVEEVVIDVDDEYSGPVVEAVSTRKGELQDMRPSGGGKQRLTFLCPSRGLIGYHGEFMTQTRGTGILNRIFHSYKPMKGQMPGRRHGVLISLEQGKSSGYALFNLEDRGQLMIESGEAVYGGMIIGEHTRDNDLEVNPLKSKQLTNFRASGKDDAIVLSPPVKLTLERAISYIQDDELVEITPNVIRLRKKYLDMHERKRQSRKSSVV